MAAAARKGGRPLRVASRGPVGVAANCGGVSASRSSGGIAIAPTIDRRERELRQEGCDGIPLDCDPDLVDATHRAGGGQPAGRCAAESETAAGAHGDQPISGSINRTTEAALSQ